MPNSEKLTKAQESGYALIREWQAAFRDAHQKEPPLVTFERGWFRFHTGYCRRYSRAHMEGMLSRLKSRVAAARSSSLPSRSSSLEGEGCCEDLGIGQREVGNG